MRLFILMLCGFLTAGLALCAPAGSASRQITIFNSGDEPIFWVAAGHVHTSQWSADMLPSNDVIDVGEAKAVTVPNSGQCVYDLRAKYDDGDTAYLTGVNLCTVSSVRFEH
ncbi:MAG: hypothetical protein ABR584_10435 [Candidatus Baltobacteraceae bacterium]